MKYLCKAAISMATFLGLLLGLGAAGAQEPRKSSYALWIFKCLLRKPWQK